MIYSVLKESTLGAKKAKPVKTVQRQPAQAVDTPLQKALKWAEKNYAVIAGAAGAILLIVVLSWWLAAHKRSELAHAQSDYAVIASRMNVQGHGITTDWEKIIPDLQDFIAKYKDTAPALNARLNLAKALFETKRYPEAVKTGEEALDNVSSGNSLRPLIMYQLAYAYEAAGKADQAAGLWTKLKKLEMSELEREADWNLARIFEAKKDFAKAAEMYQSASKASGDYPSASLIDRQMTGVSGLK
jgi:predicted negative regulator of RcsB-dependent stress response